MAFTPFMQGSEAQGIISNYLGGGYDTTSATPFRNPIFDIRTQQELAGDLDPSALYPNPQIDFSVQEDEIEDPCPIGYQLIDGVCQPIENFDYAQPSTQGQGDDEEDVLTFSEQEYNRMRRDPNNPFGAGIELDKWKVEEDEFGNTVYKYKKRGFAPNIFGIFDAITGGNKRREAKFNEAIKTKLGQTQSSNFFGKNFNPLAFGYQDSVSDWDDTFIEYSPQNYLAQVSDVVIPGSNEGSTMGELLATVGQGTQGTQQVNTGQQGTQVSQNLGSLLQDSGRRDDTAYEAAIAKNIARNLADRDSTTGKKKSTASTGSGYSTSLGGFYKGR
jgi:hypothetical protein